MLFRQVFDPVLAHYAYLVGCQQTREALIIDPQRDIDRYVAIAKSDGLTITAVAETHIHADFLSGAREFAQQYGTVSYLSDEGGEDWKYEWPSDRYDVVWLKDGDVFSIGNIDLTALHTPGHTPEHMSLLVTDRGGGATTPMGIATGDFVFVGDLGRPDLLEQAAGMHGMQEPAAHDLYHSLSRFNELRDHLQVWPAHGAGSACGKALGAVPMTTVGYERLYNVSLAAANSGEDAFVDAILSGQPEPPLYFARMKVANKVGPPLLGGLPQPTRLSVQGLADVVATGDALVLDTRPSRTAYMARHVPGSQYAPLNKSFNTVVGSLVEDETQELVLIVDDGDLDRAIRDLIRVGYDNIVAYADYATLDAYFDGGGASSSIEVIDFEEVRRLVEADNSEDFSVLDTRYVSEYDARHVDGAVNASYTRLAEIGGERLPEGRTLLVHCKSGTRAAPASSYLSRKGFDVRYVDDAVARYKGTTRGE